MFTIYDRNAFNYVALNKNNAWSKFIIYTLETAHAELMRAYANLRACMFLSCKSRSCLRIPYARLARTVRAVCSVARVLEIYDKYNTYTVYGTCYTNYMAVDRKHRSGY